MSKSGSTELCPATTIRQRFTVSPTPTPFSGGGVPQDGMTYKIVNQMQTLATPSQPIYTNTAGTVNANTLNSPSVDLTPVEDAIAALAGSQNTGFSNAMNTLGTINTNTLPANLRTPLAATLASVYTQTLAANLYTPLANTLGTINTATLAANQQANVTAGMATQGYTSTRAGKLDNADVATSTRATPAQILLNPGTPIANNTGNGGLKFWLANIQDPTATINLSGTTINTVTNSPAGPDGLPERSGGVERLGNIRGWDKRIPGWLIDVHHTNQVDANAVTGGGFSGAYPAKFTVVDQNAAPVPYAKVTVTGQGSSSPMRTDKKRRPRRCHLHSQRLPDPHGHILANFVYRHIEHDGNAYTIRERVSRLRRQTHPNATAWIYVRSTGAVTGKTLTYRLKSSSTDGALVRAF